MLLEENGKGMQTFAVKPERTSWGSILKQYNMRVFNSYFKVNVKRLECCGGKLEGGEDNFLPTLEVEP